MSKTYYHLTEKSGNSKTGAIAVSTTSANTCPKSCTLKCKGCYAKAGPLRMHWNKVSSGERGITRKAFCEKLAALPSWLPVRLNQAGDLEGKGDLISMAALKDVIRAAKGKKVFTYCHYPMTKTHNRIALRLANLCGLTINASADSVKHADELLDIGVSPVACLVLDSNVKQTPKGRKVVVCPAQTKDGITCDRCMLCQKANRDFVVGFLPHGNGRKGIEEKLKNEVGA